MEFLADIKAVKLNPMKTVITLDVSPENTGDINGLQLLMASTVSVKIDPIQTAFQFAEEE